jgi:hypothetical protein
MQRVTDIALGVVTMPQVTIAISLARRPALTAEDHGAVTLRTPVCGDFARRRGADQTRRALASDSWSFTKAEQPDQCPDAADEHGFLWRMLQ